MAEGVDESEMSRRRNLQEDRYYLCLVARMLDGRGRSEELILSEKRNNVGQQEADDNHANHRKKRV